MKQRFDQVIAAMEQRLDQAEFNRWLKPLKHRHSSENTVSIEVPNIFFKQWISDNYLDKIQTIVPGIYGREMEMDFVLPDSFSSEIQPSEPNIQVDPEEPADEIRYESGLNKKYTFDNYVVGNSNQLAHAAALAVSSRKTSYNPLFIYGSSGLGKTHLLHAIGNMLLAADSTLRVVYLSTEQFTNELIDAIRTKRMDQFRQKYRNINALLIDDIHFIGGRERTQEEFFYTFNALYEADQQIIFTSDKVPKQIPDLEIRLRSRFEGGLFADISEPDQETKVAILSKKAEEEELELSNEVAFYLASQEESNVRLLEGHLARLGAYAAMTKATITLEMAQKLLGPFFEGNKTRISLDQILRITAGFFDVKVSDLKSSKKQQAVAKPRQAAMFLARKLTPLSTVDIGRKIGGRDHSTVIHADNRVKKRIDTDKEFAQTLRELEEIIKNSRGRE